MHKVPHRLFVEIADQYEAIIFDIWGVVYDGIKPYNGAIERINKLISQDKMIAFLSNAPRPQGYIKGLLTDWGVISDKISAYTSGEMFRDYVNQDIDNIKQHRFYHIGGERNNVLTHDLEISLVDDVKNASCLIISAYTDPGEDFSRYDDILKYAARAKLPSICANPDMLAQHGDGIRKCAGSLAVRYVEFGGSVEYFGKPDSKIFDMVIDRFFPGVKRNRILMVGDTIETDILGANRAGIKSVLLMTGNSRHIGEEINNPGNIFASKHLVPDWVSPALE